jgi:hypothetical protein
MKVIFSNKGGRPPTPEHLKRVAIPLRLPRWLADWLNAQPATRAKLIEAALLKAHKLRTPK